MTQDDPVSPSLCVSLCPTQAPRGPTSTVPHHGILLFSTQMISQMYKVCEDHAISVKVLCSDECIPYNKTFLLTYWYIVVIAFLVVETSCEQNIDISSPYKLI